MKCDPITELQRAIALVRPVGMTDSAVRDWLTTAVAEVADFAKYRPARFMDAANRARKTCTHHGQIVPAILESRFYAWEIADGSYRNGLKALSGETETAPALPTNPETQKLIEKAKKDLKA